MSFGVEALINGALALQLPWVIQDFKLCASTKHIDFDVSCTGVLLTCPECGATPQPVHGRLSRKWRHLDFFPFEAWLHADVPAANCSLGHAEQSVAD